MTGPVSRTWEVSAAAAGADLDRAEDLVARARQAAHNYRTGEARVLLEEATSTLHPYADRARPPGADRQRLEGLRLRVRITTCWVSFEEAGAQRSIADLAPIEQEALALDRPDLVGVCAMVEGLLRGRSADAPGALQAMERAERWRAAMDTDDQARLLLNRGVLALMLGRLSQATEDLGAAGAVAAQADLPSLTYKALHNQGYVEFLRGDLPRALHLMERAEATEAEVERGVAHLDRARVLLEAGLVDEAVDALELAARITAEAGGRHDLAEIELDLARADLLTGDPRSAVRRAGAARRRFHRRRQDGWRRAAQAVELEAMALARSAPGPRGRLAAALQASAQAAGDDQVALRANSLRAEVLVQQGRAEEATAVLAATRPLLRSPHLATRMSARYVSALVRTAAGHPESASGVLRRAARDLGSAQRGAPGLDLRTALAVHGHRLVGLDLDLAVRSGSVDRVLTRTEMWREVVRALPPVRAEPDRRTAQLVGRLRTLREDLRMAPPATDTRSLRAEVGATERAVREVDWATVTDRVGATGPAPLSARAIGRAVADAGVVLLSYLARGDRLYAVLVRPDGRRTLHDLAALEQVAGLVQSTRSDLGAAAVSPTGPLRGAVRASLAQGLSRLEEVLLRPLNPRPGHTPGRSGATTHGTTAAGQVPLVVVPTPMLTALPWGMLPSRRGRPTTVARSATTWAGRHTVLAGAPEVVAVAGPDVPLADAEVRDVAAAWGGGRVLSADAARTGEVVAALRGADLVHVAAHGEHHVRNPLFSSLRLGDGVLFAHELEGHRLRASHVVLSACEGGRVSVRRGDEALGLSASLLALGVGTVVAPVSAMPDDIAHRVMRRYHEEAAAGADAATALARATGEGDPLAAAFTCFGSTWRVAPPGGDGRAGPTAY